MYEFNFKDIAEACLKGKYKVGVFVTRNGYYYDKSRLEKAKRDKIYPYRLIAIGRSPIKVDAMGNLHSWAIDKIIEFKSPEL